MAQSPDIPSFAKPLAPYLKSRQEALQIRKALTLYLQSHVAFIGADPSHATRDHPPPSHLSLRVPQDSVVDVKDIPSDLTGLRQEYLRALQANLTARKEYNALTDKIANTLKPQTTTTTAPDSTHTESNVESYLALLHDRQKYSKLQIFSQYLQELKAREVTRAEYFEQAADHQRLRVPTHDEFQNAEQQCEVPGIIGDDNLEELVCKLEKAVIQAKTKLDQEKALLEELKQRRRQSPLDTQPISPAKRALALQCVRNELVQWVEDKLAVANENDGNKSEEDDDDATFHEFPSEKMDKSAQLLEQRKEHIRRRYAAYVKTRKDLIDVVHGASQTIAQPSSERTRLQTKPKDKSTTAEPSSSSSLEPVNILSYASKNVLPLSKSQKALALQKSYLSGLLSKESSTMGRTLNRLSDESHLLPEYSILDYQPHFKHTTIGSLNSRQEQREGDNIVSLAEAWAFASRAAGDNQKEFVGEKVDLGSEIVQSERQTLEELYSMLNQDLDSVIGEGHEDVNIRSHEAGSITERQRRLAKGPFSRLEGGIGITKTND